MWNNNKFIVKVQTFFLFFERTTRPGIPRPPNVFELFFSFSLFFKESFRVSTIFSNLLQKTHKKCFPDVPSNNFIFKTLNVASVKLFGLNNQHLSVSFSLYHFSYHSSCLFSPVFSIFPFFSALRLSHSHTISAELHRPKTIFLSDLSTHSHSFCSRINGKIHRNTDFLLQNVFEFRCWNRRVRHETTCWPRRRHSRKWDFPFRKFEFSLLKVQVSRSDGNC